MRTGQILTAVGAIIYMIAVLVFPMFHIPQQSPAMAMELSFGLWMVLGAVAVLAIVAVGYALRKARDFAILNVAVSGLLVAFIIYLSMSAPHLFRTGHQLPFDEDSGKFIGFMAGGIGLYACWISSFLALAGAVITLSSQPRYGADTRFLRLALLWRDSVLRETVVEEPRNITVGEDIRNDYVVSHAPAKMVLFRFTGGTKAHNYTLKVDPALKAGTLHIDGRSSAVSQFSGKDISLKDSDWGVFRFGENSLFFQFTQPANLVGKKYFGHFEHGFATSMLLSTAVQVAFLLVLAIQAPDVNYASRSKETFARLIKIETRRMEAEKEKQKKEEEEKKEQVKEEKKEEKVPEEVPEEQPPIPDKPIEKAGDPLKKDIDIDKLMKNQLKPVKDDHRGLDAKRDKLAKDKKQSMLAVLQNKSRKKSALSSILGKQKNLVAKNAVWGEDGDYVLENEGQSDLAYDGASLTTGDYGGGGLGGAGGFGDGGGGGGFGGGGAFGMGGMGGVGGLSGIGGADAARAGRQALAGLKGKGRARASRVAMGSGGVSGFCNKQDVLKTVQRRASAIRSCYEVALQMNPDLKGKIVVKWTINLDGKVQGVSIVSNSMNNRKVEECMDKVIGHMRFKKPSGGICIIKWPFVFSSAETEE